MANDSDDDDLPPLERDSVAPVHYSRRSLLALTSPEEPAAAKRPEQPSALAVAAAKRSLDAPKNGASGGSEATTGGASPKKEAALWQAADLTCRSTVKGVRRRKPRPRPPATLIKKERYDCGYSSAPDEPTNGAEQRRRSLEYQTPPATPIQYDSEDDFFSPKKFREPEDFEHPSVDDDDGDRPRPRSSYVRSSSTALEDVLLEKPALSEATQQQRAAVMAEKRRQHLARWPTRRQPELVDTVTELREHFSGASRLDALRTKLTEEMKLRNMGIGDMFALVDDDKSLSLDASELHDMARRLNTNCRLQDAEQLVAERGERGEITIEAFVEWFHEAEDPLVKARNERQRRCKTPSADLSKRRGYGVYGMGRAQAKHERAFDSYASQSINVDFNNATDGQLLQVDACLLDVDVRRIVEQFWRLADQDKTGTLEYEEYIELSLTKVHVEQNGLRQYGSSSKKSTWAPLKSLHLKEALDGVVRSLVRGIEAGTGTRVRSLTSVWALDEKKATRVVDNGVPDAPAMTFERALEVEFLQPLHRGASDAGSVYGGESRAHGAAIGPCPGGFCGLARIDESDATDGAPADQAQRLHRAMRSAVEESKREACTGEALDFWPDELVRWCLKTTSTRCDQPRPLLDLQLCRPSIFLAHPTQDTQACPGQIVEIRWVCRGPPPQNLRIDVEFVPTASTVEDEFLVQPRDSTFVASIKQKAAVLREEAAQATWAAAHSRPAPSPPKPRPPPTPTAKLGSSLLNALDGGASHFEPQDSLASVFGTVQPERGEDSLRSVFGGASPRKPRRRRPKRKPRTYADLLHPWQRLLRDQIDTVVSPEPPAAPNPDALLDSLLDMAEQGDGDGLSYF